MQFEKNISLAPYTTFGIGGKADLFFIAKTADDVVKAVRYARENVMPFFMLGKGANILIGDKGFRGLVIKNEAGKYTFEDNFLTADAGVSIEELIAASLKNGLSGLEHFAGIPSTLGGALWQNLHFLSPDRKETLFIGDLVTAAVIYTSDNLLTEVNRDYFQFDYDFSSLHEKDDIVISATLRLEKKDRGEIKETIEKNLAWRGEKHPENATRKSAGSVFKKIEGFGAGRLIEKVGLKGYKIGGAQISQKHANFIINTGNATASDVRQLIALVQKKIKEELGLDIKTEISFIGEF